MAYISLSCIRYSRAWGSYQDFLDRRLLLTRKLLNQWFLLVKLKSSLGTFYRRHHDMVDCYGISLSQMTTDMLEILIGTPSSGISYTTERYIRHMQVRLECCYIATYKWKVHNRKIEIIFLKYFIKSYQ
jgi:hypothetical protein